MSSVVDLFAGPGGWDLAAHRLGLDPLGIEWDDAACATRKAAGLRTLQADVAELDPRDFPCDGLIASPPCQAWSMAGKRGGERDKELCVQAAMELAAGNDTRADLRAKCEDERSMLVVEPLRWTLANRPTWVAFEQVPPVLEMWSLLAQLLGAQGYRVWTGVLEAERYGVPQTRERAILIARSDRPVHPPQATHQRYVKGEPQRHDVTFDGEILPWISMAQALGWDEGAQPAPAPTVTGGGGAAGGVEVFASKAARGRARAACVQTNNFSAVARDADGKRTKAGSVPYERSVDDPAPTLDTSVQGWKYRASTMPNAAVRDVSEPAPTVLFGHASNDVSWVHDRPAPTIVTTRRSDEGIIVGRQLAPGEGRNVGGHGWTHERPATTVSGDPRGLPEPKYRKGNERQWNENAVRVTVEQASILQSFPPDYPWQGSRTKQFEQIGNAVPPGLAEPILRAVADFDEEGRLPA